MAEKKQLSVPFLKETGALAAALAEKGTPGMITLGVVFFIVWIVPVIFTSGFFIHLPTRQVSGNWDFWFAGGYLTFGLIGLSVLTGFSYALTKSALKSIVPTIKAEAEAANLLSRAFGGKVPAATGGLALAALDHETAKRRIRKIMETLVRRAATVVEVTQANLVRANIFVTRDGRWLRMAEGFHVHMMGGTPKDRELTIKILNGYLSSGTAYKYFVPVLSASYENEQGNIVWDHTPDRETLRQQGIDDALLKKIDREVAKAHPELRWIVSMPIPYQVRPFKMTCGVMNVDGLRPVPFRDQLKNLLADASTAAALIGVINRTTDILRGQCQRQEEIPENVGGIKESRLVERFMIASDDFDPADCPEPTEEFKNALSEIKGLEFFRRITTTDVAEFLREQLRS